MEIVSHARRCKKIRGAARYFSSSTITIRRSQVRKWILQDTTLTAKLERNAKELSTHIGPWCRMSAAGKKYMIGYCHE